MWCTWKNKFWDYDQILRLCNNVVHFVFCKDFVGTYKIMYPLGSHNWVGVAIIKLDVRHVFYLSIKHRLLFGKYIEDFRSIL